MTPSLRPIERCIIRLRDEGVAVPEIAKRLNKRPGTVERIMAMIDLPYRDADDGSRPGGKRSGLRPLERVVLAWRDRGEGYGEIGNRVGRSGAQVRRIEQYVRFKQGAGEPAA